MAFSIRTTVLLTACALPAVASAQSGRGYEVWAADQSNSVAGIASPGVFGSYLWIWDSEDIEAQLAGGPDAVPLGCGPGNAPGPCDLLDVFPADLVEYDADGNPTGNTLADSFGFGRLHGMLPDPQNQYFNVNMFTPNGGYIGVIDAKLKTAVALFRVTETAEAVARSVHMSYWSTDGSAILVSNLNGKLLERIDVERNGSGKIKSLTLNRSATLGVGKNQSVVGSATVFRGPNARGKGLIGSVAGSYADADLGDLTPSGVCKENGCAGPNGAAGGRANNLIICPIPSDNDHAYVTLGGGGLLVADIRTTPMSIVAEYGAQVVNGAGCGGAQVGDTVWLNAGVSASPAGATQSTFTIYTIDDGAVAAGSGENHPLPAEIFKDPTNTGTTGNVGGLGPNLSGQLPGTSTRRDSHGMVPTVDGSYIHTVDRIQNVVEVFDAATPTNQFTYDLTSGDGAGGGSGACEARAVSDDPGLPKADPAPDLLWATPDGKYLMIALRGPVPVSVDHSSQGACPGVGIVELTDGGASGALVDVLRSTNTIDTATGGAPGGHAYTGAERSDIHGVAVIRK